MSALIYPNAMLAALWGFPGTVIVIHRDRTRTTRHEAANIDIAQARRRFGYRRIDDVLRPAFPRVNHKRVYRLYSAARLAVKKRKKVKRDAHERVPLSIAHRLNAV